MYSEKYRSLQYQIKYKKDLSVLEKATINRYTLADHFAKRGYENLYLSEGGKIVAIVTFEDYLQGVIVEGLERDFVHESIEFLCGKDIEHFFIDNPDVDRISVIEDGNLICEIDSMIEISIQNGLAKNLMSLRYVDIFRDELLSFFEKYKSILLLADSAIVNYVKSKFPEVAFDSANNIEKVVEDQLADNYDILIDLKYCSNIRRMVNYKPQNMISLSQIMMSYATKRLNEYCETKGAHVLFYKIQKFDSLNCLTEHEYNNAIGRVKTGRIIKDGRYFSEYETTPEEMAFIRNRMYQASFRLDDGFCFVQDDSNEHGIKVQNNVRSTGRSCKVDNDSQHICFYGPCTTFGFLVPDEMTIPAIVESRAIADGNRIVAENRAGIHGYNEINAVMAALNTPIRKGDILVILDSLDDLDFDEYPNAKDAAEWFNRDKDPNTTMFFDFPGHCGFKANKILASNIYEDIRPYIGSETISNVKRSHYQLCDIDRFESMRVTHASCLRFFMNYEQVLFSKETYKEIGALLIPDEYNSNQCRQMVNKAKKYCDALYVIKYNINLPTIDFCKDFYDRFEDEYAGCEVRLMQLDRFYYSCRYSTDFDKFAFTEKALVVSILKELKVNTRFLIRDAGKVNKYIEKICADENIASIYI